MVDRPEGGQAGLALGWRMRDGRTLVAGPSEPWDMGPPGLDEIFGGEPADPGGVGVRTYYALDASGAVDRVYDTRVFSLEDELYVTTYQVEENALYVHQSSYDHRYAEARHERSLECAGLIPLTPARIPPWEQVLAALAELAGREQAEAAVRRGGLDAVRAAFTSALPEHPGDGVLRLELTLEGERPVVRLSGGHVLWRPTEVDHTYKELLALLRAVLPVRYGDGPVELVPSQDIVDHAFWDPWN
ncbi:hypothetical protein [Streptosporangium amethystogenes]|uniref:hypothetical protein n=1 Tax=Streptosporangium amethystogenes TaxID=2002 RepID=UPI0004C81663|nr:hypothetical protein [Streptosporangium amethystogenes]